MSTYRTSPYTQLNELLGIRFHVKHRKLSSQQVFATKNSGDNRTQRKGRGMEFSEVRQYQAGDDVRHIDWRVSARTQTTHTKIFTEEIDKPVLCLVEQTPNLFFGSRRRFKSDQAMQVLATIAWATLNQNDKIGGLVFSHQAQHWVDPKHQQSTLMRLFNYGLKLQKQLKIPSEADSQHWISALKSIQKQAKPGQKIFLIGDLMQFPQQGGAILQVLKRHLDINAIHIFDELEMELPKLGLLRLTNSKTELQLDSSEQKVRADYTKHYNDMWQETQQSFSQIKIPLIAISAQEVASESLFKQGVIK